MIEVAARLFVGSEADYRECAEGNPGWAVVHACKEPFHREAVGYSGRALAKTHPEYLVARRGDRLCLNIVDVADPAFMRRELFDAALTFMAEHAAAGTRVLVHCNQGRSRSPSIALLYLAGPGGPFHGMPFEAAEERFGRLYPDYAPAGGVRGYVKHAWPTADASREIAP